MSNKKFMMFLLAGALITGAPQLPAFADSADQVSVTAEENNIISNDEVSDVSVEEETVESEKELPAETVANVTGKDVAEDDSEFTERILYTTYNRDDDPSEHLKDEVIVNGKTYKLKTASQPVYVKSENIDPDEMMYNSEVFTGDENSQEHAPKQYMTDDSGKEYELVSKELLEQTAQERTEYREAVVEYNDVEAGVVLPKDHEIKFTDADTAQEVTAELDYIREQVISEDWVDDFAFTITIENCDAEILELDGIEIPNGDDLNNYKSEFLNYLKLDPDSYRIDNIALNDDVYTNNNGVLCRTATATGSKLVRDINVTYGGEVTLPSITGKSWSCVYREIIPEDESVIYTMASNATYALAASTVQEEAGFWDTLVGYIIAAYEAVVKAFKEHPVISSIPIVLAAAFIAFLITRKVRNRCIYDKNIKCPYKKRNKETCKSCVNYHKRQRV